MLKRKANSKRMLSAIGILGLTALMLLPATHAGSLKPVAGEFTVVMQGVDPDTGELIFEGPKGGPIPGHLAIRAGITRQTGAALHLAARWTLTTPWGETMDGENTLLLNTKSLHFREHGVIVSATGDLTERIGNFIVIHGTISDLDFIPGVTEVNGQSTIVPSQAKKNQ